MGSVLWCFHYNQVSGACVCGTLESIVNLIVIFNEVITIKLIRIDFIVLIVRTHPHFIPLTA